MPVAAKKAQPKKAVAAAAAPAKSAQKSKPVASDADAADTDEEDVKRKAQAKAAEESKAAAAQPAAPAAAAPPGYDALDQFCHAALLRLVSQTPFEKFPKLSLGPIAIKTENAQPFNVYLVYDAETLKLGLQTTLCDAGLVMASVTANPLVHLLYSVNVISDEDDKGAHRWLKKMVLSEKARSGTWKECAAYFKSKLGSPVYAGTKKLGENFFVPIQALCARSQVKLKFRVEVAKMLFGSARDRYDGVNKGQANVELVQKLRCLQDLVIRQNEAMEGDNKTPEVLSAAQEVSAYPSLAPCPERLRKFAALVIAVIRKCDEISESKAKEREKKAAEPEAKPDEAMPDKKAPEASEPDEEKKAKKKAAPKRKKPEEAEAKAESKEDAKPAPPKAKKPKKAAAILEKSNDTAADPEAAEKDSETDALLAQLGEAAGQQPASKPKRVIPPDMVGEDLNDLAPAKAEAVAVSDDDEDTRMPNKPAKKADADATTVPMDATPTGDAAPPAPDVASAAAANGGYEDLSAFMELE